MNLIDILKKNNKIILSLNEEYFVKMQKKEKKYEYRKRFLNQKSYAFIYISKTKKEIAGIVEFGVPKCDSSENIAKFASQIGDSTYDNIISYLGENKKGYAIPINKVYLFDSPIKISTLKKIDKNFYAPQSYSYLKEKSNLYNYLKNSTIQLIEIL
jgi:hypothetical protein